jgi:hypothetical protein
MDPGSIRQPDLIKIRSYRQCPYSRLADRLEGRTGGRIEPAYGCN